MSIVLVSGITGAGKSVLIDKLISTFSEYQRPIAYTTRAEREGESEQFCHVSDEEMDSLLKDNKLLSHDIVHKNRYALSRYSIEQIINSGKIVIKEFYIMNLEQIKSNYSCVCSVIIVPSSLDIYNAHIESIKSTKVRSRQRGKKELSIHQEAINQGSADILIINDFSQSIEEIALVLNIKIKSFFENSSTVD
ncbi:MAG: hypothetical protein ABTQ25_15995 [Nitrosomonas ureae]